MIQATINLETRPGFLPDDFALAVKSLVRPYIPISKEDHDRLQQVLIENNCDFFALDNGQWVTIGNADCGYALMPLAPWAQREYEAMIE